MAKAEKSASSYDPFVSSPIPEPVAVATSAAPSAPPRLEIAARILAGLLSGRSPESLGNGLDRMPELVNTALAAAQALIDADQGDEDLLGGHASVWFKRRNAAIIRRRLGAAPQTAPAPEQKGGSNVTP